MKKSKQTKTKAKKKIQEESIVDKKPSLNETRRKIEDILLEREQQKLFNL
ncbi:hypothetical protein HUO09_07140 [Vibrio sp. Y2-5]|nr:MULTISPECIES: hypothetical protein [Vibrio]MBD0786113.1 hypothetical protein [Vibrio sp. Y2-5]NIY90657.1 hypothetical protein [Vibrio diazotrophicus]